jgi:uncharacterized membrane protein YidH (DUF202 family)
MLGTKNQKNLYIQGLFVYTSMKTKISRTYITLFLCVNPMIYKRKGLSNYKNQTRILQNNLSFDIELVN